MGTVAPLPGDDMGFFDRFRRAKASTIGDPAELRESLIVAASGGNRKQLTALSRANRESIATHFPAWRQLPEAIRDDRTRAERYIHGLIAIAEVFAQDLGDPTLIQFLTGPDKENPLARWGQGLECARAQVEALDYRTAATTLNDLLIEVRSLRGTVVDRYLPITYGQLGDCYFHSGAAEKAISPFRHALELCEHTGDTAGIIAYLGNLHEVHRYLGRTDEAADFAERLADALTGMGRFDEADTYRQCALRVRAGEPLNRVVVEVAGRRYEVAEAPSDRGRKGPVLPRAEPDLAPPRDRPDRTGKRLGHRGRP